MKIPLFVKSILIGVPVGVTFFDCVGYVAKVEGVSMQPALNPDDTNSSDYVFLSKWPVIRYNIKRGDVISLISPKDPDQNIIKRVVGLQGDVIPTIGYKKPYVKVPEGHCWIEGDHTGRSMDSNSFGPVSLGLMTGKASHIVWPPARWQRINSKIPSQRRPVSLGKPRSYNDNS